MTGDETGMAQAEKDFRALLRTLCILRARVPVTWRGLAAGVGVAPSTLESWLRHGRVPDEVDGVRKAASLLLVAARGARDALTVDCVLRIEGVDWAQAHAAVQASRAGGRSRSARSGRARRSSPQHDVPARRRDSVAHRKVSSWTARQLRVHDAVRGERSEDALGQFVLPHYVPREHDARVHAWLQQLVEHDEAALLVLRGGSCTGKTRTAYEAVQAVMPGWRLLYPKTTQALTEALAEVPASGGTVVWLDDVHRLLAEPAGEQAAAVLLEMLDRPGPVAAVATIWPQNYQELTATPRMGQADRHGQARSLLGCGWLVDVPMGFTGQAWHDFQRRAALDASLSAVAAAARGAGAVAQTLAAGPQLMDHWRQAPSSCGKAVLTAAVDARRLGIRSPLPETFLKEAAPGYLTARERSEAVATWFEDALDYARRPIKQVTSALLPVPAATGMGAEPDVVDLADYLEQHGGDLRWDQVPPATFWDAALAHLAASEDIERLAVHAFSRGRYRISRELYVRAHALGHPSAVEGLCFSYTETDRLLIPPAREELAVLARASTDGGYSLWYVGSTLASVSLDNGDEDMRDEAEELLAESVHAGYMDAAYPLADVWESVGMRQEAAQLLAYARERDADAAVPAAPVSRLAEQIKAALAAPGRADEQSRITATPAEIRALGRRLTVEPTALPLGWQKGLLACGETDLVEQLLRALVDADSRIGLDRLEKFLEAQGRAEEAAALLPAAAEKGDDFAVADLVSRWSQNRPTEARDLLERCRRTGRTKAVFLTVRRLLRRPGPSEPRRIAEEHLALLAEAGSSAAQLMLALWRLEQWQDQEPAGKEAVPSDIVALLQQASRDQAEACRLLGQHALLAGEVSEAARRFRGAVDAGHYTVLADLAHLVVDDSREEARLLLNGLEADGSASTPW